MHHAAATPAYQTGHMQFGRLLQLAFVALLFGLGIGIYLLRIFAVFGDFAGGSVFELHHRFVKPWRCQFGRFVRVFFLPISFAYGGLRTNVMGLTTQSKLMSRFIVLGAATGGKIAPVNFVADRSGFHRDESAAIGVSMSTLGLTALIVLGIGLELGVIPEPVCGMLVVMVLVTTVLTIPLLRAVLPRTGRRIPIHVEA